MSPSSGHRSGDAFTLIELLAVVAIIVLLLSFSTLGFTNILRSRRNAEAASQIIAEIEAARQYATGQSTYVWLALSAPPSSTSQTPLYMITVAANTGMSEGYGPEDPWNAATINLTSNTRFRQIRKMVTVPDFTVEVPSGSPALSSSPTFKLARAGTTYTFPRVIEFTPNGEAKIAPSNTFSILMRVTPQQPRPGDFITEITLNGLTGTLQTSEITP